MKYLLIIFILLPAFASAHDLTFNITKEEHKLMHVLEKYLIDDSSRVRKFTYKKIVKIFSRNSLAHFIELLEKKEHPELRYIAKLLKKQFFKSVIKPKTIQELLNKAELYEQAKKIK